MDKKLTLALESFIGAIEAVGGIFRDRKGYPRPIGDPDWIDLGKAYLQACHELGREPLETEGEEP
jgi:hypothetical protein